MFKALLSGAVAVFALAWNPTILYLVAQFLVIAFTVGLGFAKNNNHLTKALRVRLVAVLPLQLLDC